MAAWRPQATRWVRRNRPTTRRAMAALLLAALAVWGGLLLHQTFVLHSHGFLVFLSEGRDTPLAVRNLAGDPVVEPLPLVLRLHEAAPRPRARLVMWEGAMEEAVTVAPDDEIEIGGLRLVVADIAPWTGLLHAPDGMPMAHIGLDVDDGASNILLPAGQWVTLTTGARALLVWHANEETARAASQRLHLDEHPARWGVIEGEGINWFSAFTPGTGLELDDGRQVVLLERADGDAAIRVLVVGPEGGEERIIPANAPGADPLVRYENPAALPVTVVVDAWNDSTALVTCLERGERVAQTELAVGRAWSAPCLPARVWLAGLAPKAVPVYPEDAGPSGVLLTGPDWRCAIGELQSGRVGDVTVAVQGLDAAWDYTLDVHREGAGEDAGRMVLSTDQAAVRVEAWRITALPPSAGGLEAAQVMIEPVAVSPNAWRVLGVGIGLGGAIFLLILVRDAMNWQPPWRSG